MRFLIIGGIVAVAAQAATAQNMTLGEMEYMNSCAACHGVSGQGDGPMAPHLVTQDLPDLSMLAANNGGVFPVTAAFSTIDGTMSIGAHGSGEMPVWGQRYIARAANDPGMPGYDLQEFANLRVLALIEYLMTIQN